MDLWTDDGFGLTRELFKHGHKVLFLSSFFLFFFLFPSSRNIETEVIQIFRIGWVTRMGLRICRIDGSTAPLERREQMNLFQTGGDDHKALCLFLLSTRVGGLGFNLIATDTVIFYDQDWVCSTSFCECECGVN